MCMVLHGCGKNVYDIGTVLVWVGYGMNANMC